MVSLKFGRHKFVWVLGVIVLLVAGILAYQAIARQINQRDFKSARAAIDTVYAQIVAKVGQPDNYKRTNDCSRPSREFGQGPLSCSVGTDFIYGVDSQDQANQLFKSIQAVISSRPDLFKPTQPLSKAITDTLVVNTYYHSAEDSYKRPRGMDCSIKYTFNTPTETFLSLSDISKLTLFMSLGCDNWAKAQYYPLEH